MGDGKKTISNFEMKISKSVRKSIVAKKNIKKNTIIEEHDICFKRPGTGYLPIEKNKVIGKFAKIQINKNRVIKKNHVT